MRYQERDNDAAGPLPPQGSHRQGSAAQPVGPYRSQNPQSPFARTESPARMVRTPPPAPSSSGTEETRPVDLRGSLTRFSPCLIALVIGVVALKTSQLAKIGPYGLVEALSPLYYIAIIMLIASFAWNLRTKLYRSVLLGIHLTVLVFLLDGAPALIEGAARFQTAYLHVGFAGYIANTGGLLPNFDARFGWPSFFEGVAMLDKVAGVSSAEVFLRWWPVALNLLYLPLIYGIAKSFLGSDLRAWVATALFPLANWVGQDYFSPQSLAYLLYLTFFFILVGPLGGRDRPMWQSILRLGQRRASARRPVPWDQQPRPERAGSRALMFYLGVLVLLMAAMATAHQLTPVMAVVTAVVLVVTGRTQVRGMAILFALIAIGWFCYGAVTFWSGHIGMVIGGFGNVGGNVGSTVVSRVAGSQAHERVVDSRLLAAGSVWLLAGVGALVWRPRSESRLALPLVFFASFAMVAGGNYGGEGMLRVYLFSMPGAVCLIAALISKLPRFGQGQVALGCVLLLLTPVFLVARWGNELYEMTVPGELTAMNELYKIATPGSNLVSLNSFVTWEYTDIIKYQYLFVQLDTVRSKAAVMSEISSTVAGNPAGGYVIMTANQEAYGWQVLGLPENWGATVENMLSSSPNYKLRYSSPDGEVFQYIPHPVTKPAASKRPVTKKKK